ncbi:hypothetical protein [Halosegnis rubeus]|jgi:hypothetical protein|uniref:Uncharacterized protein n=1 Tax=Halosegnis rubeus TaxID=2212850 RepID=A0A5N5UGX3_9EURY|nr:hypothetical protein [Halosegnis rubeus]KAB7517944.1 hypothetical protein DMP03_00840 [Halosegnis rubeus]KAB7519476.1 hypothetical protein DP108_05095 [Halosegnis rubeus]
MKRTHAAVFALVIAATLTLSVGTGSFTALNADRNVDIGTTDDDSAYVGIAYDAATGDLQLTNNFGTLLTVTEVETPASIVTDSVPNELAAGASETVALSCADSTQSPAGTVTVTADGEDVSVEVTRDVTIDCETATATPTETATAN